MKKHCLFLLAAGMLLFSPCIKGQFTQSSGSTLNYTRITSGLLYPEFEGGRSDFAMNDINDDGHVDLLSIGDHGCPNVGTDQHGIMVWFGDGQGNFSLHMEGDFGYGGIAVGDVNNDGLKDVGYGMHHNYSATNFGDQLIEVALGDGSGTSWMPWDEGLATNGETWGMFGTDLGDVNNNGLLDLASISFGSGAGFHVYLNQGDGSWIPGFGIVSNNNSDLLIQFADLDNDGHLDFIAGHALGTAYFGDGTGNFVNNDNGLPVQGEFTPRYGISTGDVNNDGSAGVAFTNTDGGVEVYEFNAVSETWENYSGNLPAGGGFSLTQLFDMNADGYMDVMAFGSKNFQLWLGDGSGNWTADAAFQTNTDPGHARAFRAGGDLNHNGYGDIVILANEKIGFLNWQNRLYVYMETSAPEELWIKILSPRGNENFYGGAARFIEWASAVPGAAQSAVKIEFSHAGNAGPWETVADNLPNNGKHQWTLPDIDSDNCYLRLTVSDGSATASHVTQLPFTIFGEPVSAKKPDAGTKTLFSLLPNPGGNHARINSRHDTRRIAFYDLAGQKVLEAENPGKEINTGMLPEGFYIYRVILNNGKEASGKWIKANTK